MLCLKTTAFGLELCRWFPNSAPYSSYGSKNRFKLYISHVEGLFVLKTPLSLNNSYYKKFLMYFSVLIKPAVAADVFKKVFHAFVAQNVFDGNFLL